MHPRERTGFVVAIGDPADLAGRQFSGAGYAGELHPGQSVELLLGHQRGRQPQGRRVEAVGLGNAVVAPAAPPPVVTKPAPLPKKEEVSPEMLLVIAAAVTAYMGKKVRIRSAKIVYSQESFNPWSQQGRVFVQASHNLTQRY